MAARTFGIPSPGDLLIVRDKRARKHRFVLSVCPHPGQIQYQSYEDALIVAERWTFTHDVRIWFSDDGRTFSQIVKAEAAGGPNTEATSHAE